MEIFLKINNCIDTIIRDFRVVIVISRMEFNANRLLNIETTAETTFQLRIFLFLNPCLPEFSYLKNPILVTPLKM